jgi:adenosylcobinamide-GDP ribazoletransferase
VNDALRPAAAALTFLTRVPLGRVVRVEAKDIAHGVWLFPVVGGLVGGASGLLADVTAEWLPALAAGALAVGAGAVLTGAMHLDALADAADALGGTTRERALEIMRDHAVGAFGAVALVVVCILDAALWGALAESGDAVWVGLAAGALSRAAMLLPALVLPYARADDDRAWPLAGMGAVSVAFASLLACLLVLPAGAGGLLGIPPAVVVAVAVAFVARRRFGGVTGDVLGATAKLSETSALLIAVSVLG